MSEVTTMELRRDREFGEAISDIIAFFKQNFKNLMSLYVRYGLSLMVVGFIAGLAINSIAGSSLEFQTVAMFGGLGNLVFMIFFMISTVLITAAIFGYVQGYVEGGIEEAKLAVSKYLGKNIGRILIIYFMMLCVVALIGLFMFAMFNIAGSIAGLILIPLIFLVMYFMTKFMLAPYAATQSEYSIIDAFKESYSLTDGRWWWTFGLYFIISAIGSIMMYIVMIPLMLLMMVPQFVGGDFSNMDSMNSTMLITNFIVYAGYMIYGMILILLIPFMYYSLHDRKYGTHIEERIENIEQKRDSIFENEGEV